jgi:superfamily I DNA/RNA helicase
LGITDVQKARAEKAQWEAAKDDADQIRLIAGPGTGKSSTIERRVAHLLNSNGNPRRVFTISFTRATTAELSDRIAAFCATQPCAGVVSEVSVSTMHSLALRFLRAAAVLATLFQMILSFSTIGSVRRCTTWSLPPRSAPHPPGPVK